MIYTYVLSDTVVRIKPTDARWSVTEGSAQTMLLLLKICRQMHQDTALLALKLGTFRMPAYLPGPLLKVSGDRELT